MIFGVHINVERPLLAFLKAPRIWRAIRRVSESRIKSIKQETINQTYC